MMHAHHPPGAGNVVQMKLQYKPDDYNLFEAKIHNLKKQIISGSMLRMSEKKSHYVRYLFGNFNFVMFSLLCGSFICLKGP